MIIIAMRSQEVIDSLRKHDIAHIASSIILASDCWLFF
jgi:hypothetical protein